MYKIIIKIFSLCFHIKVTDKLDNEELRTGKRFESYLTHLPLAHVEIVLRSCLFF
jgi:hypothetical protein